MKIGDFMVKEAISIQAGAKEEAPKYISKPTLAKRFTNKKITRAASQWVEIMDADNSQRAGLGLHPVVTKLRGSGTGGTRTAGPSGGL